MEKPTEKLNTRIKELESKINEYEAIFNSVRDGVAVLNKTGKIIFINKRLLEVGGYTKEEIIGKRLSVLKMFPPKSLAKIIAIFSKRFSGKEEIPPYEIEVRTKFGENKTVEIQGSLLKINNKIVGDVAVLRDVSDRKKIQEALKSSEEQFKMIFENAPDAYFLSDLKGNFLNGNRAAEKLIGYKKEEMIGKSMLKLNLLPLDQIPKAAKRLMEHALGKYTAPGEFTLVRKDGSNVFVEISGAPVKIEGKTIVLGIARDITQRKEYEEELKRKNEELEKFNKMTVGRELAIIELKEKIKELEARLNKNSH